MGRQTLREQIAFTPTEDMSESACAREAAVLANALAAAVSRMAVGSMQRGERLAGPLRITIEQDVETLEEAPRD